MSTQVLGKAPAEGYRWGLAVVQVLPAANRTEERAPFRSGYQEVAVLGILGVAHGRVSAGHVGDLDAVGGVAVGTLTEGELSVFGG